MNDIKEKINTVKYQLMTRVLNIETKEVVSDRRESCMFPSSKNIVRAAARKNGCYKIGKNLIRHSYAKPLVNDTAFDLDNNADHEISECGTSGTVYIAMPNDVSVEIYFETDARQNINLLSVGDCYQEINGISEDYDYAMLIEHEQPIKAVIKQFLNDNPIECDEYEPDYYDQRTYGFTNSDWIYA